MGLTNMDAAAKAFIVKHAEKVVDAGGFADLPKEMLVALLSNEKLNAKEESLFEAVAAWGAANKGSGGGSVHDAVADLIPHLRFEEMPHAFLHKRVRQSGLVSESILLDALLKMMDEDTPNLKQGTKCERAFDNGDGSGAGSEQPKKNRRFG